MRTSITRGEIFAICRMLGADPHDVRGITSTPHEVTVTRLLRNERGEKYVDEATGDPATETAVIPIVGGDGRDTVPMQHPNLPGRVIDVRRAGVAQRTMAGWEVVPAYDRGGTLPSGAAEATAREAEPVPTEEQSKSEPKKTSPRGRRASKGDEG